MRTPGFYWFDFVFYVGPSSDKKTPNAKEYRKKDTS